MYFRLGHLAETWNAFAKQNSPRGHVERELYRELTREVMPTLKSTELRVLYYIYSRTLMWQKFAEAIPMSHFVYGVTDQCGEPVIDSFGRVVSKGCGVRKEDTVRAAVKTLAARELIHFIPGVPGSVTPSNVYFCGHLSKLATLYIEGDGGILPVAHEYHVVGEHLIADGKIFRIVSFGREWHEVQRVDNRLRPVSSPEEWSSFEDTRRPTLDEWKEFKCRM